MGTVSTLPRVLVVEDNDDLRNGLVELIRIWGYETESASGGVEALRIALDFDPDVAFVDIDLPDLSGYDVARRLRTGERGTPFLVATTGFGRPEDRAAAKEAGFEMFLKKPFNPDALHSILQDENRMTRRRPARGA